VLYFWPISQFFYYLDTWRIGRMILVIIHLSPVFSCSFLLRPTFRFTFSSMLLIDIIVVKLKEITMLGIFPCPWG
jgi:hypothetical protein